MSLWDRLSLHLTEEDTPNLRSFSDEETSTDTTKMQSPRTAGFVGFQLAVLFIVAEIIIHWFPKAEKGRLLLHQVFCLQELQCFQTSACSA